MQPNCDHDDCWDCLEMAQECSGLIRDAITLLVTVSNPTSQLSKTKYRLAFANVLLSISRTSNRGFSRSFSGGNIIRTPFVGDAPQFFHFSKSGYQRNNIYKSK